MATITLRVNRKSQAAEVEPRTLLVELLRDGLRLTGTHVGCDTSQCGACVAVSYTHLTLPTNREV